MEVSGSGPTISWTPDCSIERLVVAAPANTEPFIYWAIAARDRRIESGVRFGLVPFGVTEEQDAARLVSGTRFIIYLESPRGTLVGYAAWDVP